MADLTRSIQDVAFEQRLPCEEDTGIQPMTDFRSFLSAMNEASKEQAKFLRKFFQKKGESSGEDNGVEFDN